MCISQNIREDFSLPLSFPLSVLNDVNSWANAAKGQCALMAHCNNK